MANQSKLAALIPREEHGWLVFPRDTKLRKELLGTTYEATAKHPAKMNAHLLLEIVKAFTKPGEHILDPFGGVGTTLFATTLGRNVTTVEVEGLYAMIQMSVIDALKERKDPGAGRVIPGDSMATLPITCNHIITSPPYGNDLSSSRNSAVNEEMAKAQQEYSAHPKNIGRLNPFYYTKTMGKLYAKMVDSLTPGGTVTITHRDRRRGEERILYSADIIRTMASLGMELYNWDKWKAPGSIQSRVNESKGLDSILDEDILTFRKPV